MAPEWTHIIVHHTASPDTGSADIDAIRRYHLSRGWRDIGYHWLVEEVGDKCHAIMGRPAFMVGSHSPGMNSSALGVAFVGDFMQKAPSSMLLDKGAELIAGLVWMCSIPLANILPHRDVRATLCPGNLFPMPNLLGRVSDYLGLPSDPMQA